ncbi:MAG: MBL fold metallo-hydrolase [Firmicutes bacterium]|nr:MBL fold metallo-hydrolase [Bacillota bacterium]
MTVQFCSFASGSSGNCYLVKDEDTAILIDAGISGKRIFQGLEDTGTPKEMVKALLVTHEHIDHVKSIPIVSKKLPNVKVHANAATWAACERPVADERKSVFTTGEDFYVGDFIIRPFPVSHDAAEPVGFSIYRGDKQISIVTDSGYVSDEIADEITDADILVLEANHEKEMLLFGSYPYNVKQRILSDEGHLSNIAAGQCLARIVSTRAKKRHVLLGHLSHENNTPEVAMQAVVNTLQEEQVYIGGDLQVQVAARDCLSRIYEMEIEL